MKGHIINKRNTALAAAFITAITVSGGNVSPLLSRAETDITAYAGISAAREVSGDVNADGKLSVADLVIMQEWLLGKPDAEIKNWQAGDLCTDGRLDAFDMVQMRRLLISGDNSGMLIESPLKKVDASTPTTGDVRMLSVYVEFADIKYRSDSYSVEQIKNELYGNGSAAYPYESVTAWYDRASYGNLHIDGDVYKYTCSGNMQDYMPDDRMYGFEKMAVEVLRGLDGQVDFGDYDSDNDGVIDCIAFTVPLDNADAATKKYWYGCTNTWYFNPNFTLDNKSVVNYIIMDVMPNQRDMAYLKQTIIHEMGHCMGLPDYYKYASDDWEGMHGIAGYERMDDSVGDFNSFSKLMCGWLRDNEVQTYSGSGTQTFSLSDASNTGSCLILPISSAENDYTSEYFLVEYVTRSGNNRDIPYDSSGIRIFHVQSELYTDEWQRTFFKYDNFSSMYMGDDKIRVIRLVNDNRGFYNTGDIVSFGTDGFAGYDPEGGQTINTGYNITIGELSDGRYSVTVSK